MNLSIDDSARFYGNGPLELNGRRGLHTVFFGTCTISTYWEAMALLFAGSAAFTGFPGAFGWPRILIHDGLLLGFVPFAGMCRNILKHWQEDIDETRIARVGVWIL